MIDETNFIIRTSGRKENSCYIDYLGVYKLTEISKVTGLEVPAIREKYTANGAVYDETVEVYYFSSVDAAKKAVLDIMRDIRADRKGRLVFLTEPEIEYIRKALINEGVNTIHVKNSIKDAIFRKLNQ